MVLKRSVFGTYVKDGVPHDSREAEQKQKGFRNHPKKKIKLKNPFHIYNHIFKYNKDYTHVPTYLIKNKVKLSTEILYFKRK